MCLESLLSHIPTTLSMRPSKKLITPNDTYNHLPIIGGIVKFCLFGIYTVTTTRMIKQENQLKNEYLKPLMISLLLRRSHMVDKTVVKIVYFVLIVNQFRF